MKIFDMINRYDSNKVNNDSNMGNRMVKINELKEQMKENESVMGGNMANDDLGKIVKDLKSQGINPSPSEIDEIKQYVEKSTASVEDKSDVVKLAYDKDIEITEGNLSKIEEAVNSPYPSDNPGEISQADSVEKSIAEVKEMDIPQELKDKIISLMSDNGMTFDQVLKVDIIVNEGSLLVDLEMDELMEIYKGFIKKPVSLLQLISSKNMSIEEMFNLDGKENPEIKGLQVLVERLHVEITTSVSSSGEFSLEDLEAELDNLIESVGQESDKLDAINDVFEVFTNEEFLTAMIGIESRNTLITEVTEKIAEVTDKFNDFKSDFLKTLRDINYRIDNGQITKSEVVDGLNDQIDKLDKLILKSEVNLYLDMKSEKKLLVMSKDLLNARNLMSEGKVSEAKKIVVSVEETMVKMKFKPSNKKIVHNLNRKALFSSDKYLSEKQYLKNISKLGSGSKSPRMLLEKLRTMGLNNGFEVDEFINSKRNQEENYEKNFKNVLLENKNNTQLSMEKISGILKTLNNISGQQMINKGGAPGENQTMMFNIPVDVMNQQKEMKVYINSKKENQKLDWENFSMYLAIDLPVFGNTGIKISAINRDMKISIKNDRDDIEIIKDALVDSFKEDLKEIGYNIVSVNIGKLSEKEGEAMLKSVSVSQSKVSSYFPDKKGFDLKL
ncbi:MAG: hypothetical protein N4A76_17845 [Firmicutes bacterium]|jgi:hypothetical protein|nr:hypothetical protein [Bacillota bacterium]